MSEAITLKIMGHQIARITRHLDSAIYCLERLRNRIHEDENGRVEFDSSEPGFGELLAQVDGFIYGRSVTD